MILLESSVLFEYERGKDQKLVALVQSLPCWLCGPVRSEALKAARTPARRATIVANLRRFPLLLTPETIWDELGDNLAALQAAGLSPSFSDALIATVAIHHNVELWSRDNHHRQMQPVLPGLRLFVEPP